MPGARKGLGRLDAMIDVATADCYGESETRAGWLAVLTDNLAVPFKAVILGVDATVQRLDMNSAEEIVAVCRLGRKLQRVPLLDLPLPSPRPEGAEWIDALRKWARGT